MLYYSVNRSWLGKKRLMPMLDVVTRRNSTYEMLARFVQIQAEIYSALADMKVI